MKVNLEDLKNPVRLKTFSGCSAVLRHVPKMSNYNYLIKLLAHLTKPIEEGGLNYTIAIIMDSGDLRKYHLYCEKEMKKEILPIIKKWWGA